VERHHHRVLIRCREQDAERGHRLDVVPDEQRVRGDEEVATDQQLAIAMPSHRECLHTRLLLLLQDVAQREVVQLVVGDRPRSPFVGLDHGQRFRRIEHQGHNEARGKAQQQMGACAR